MPVRGNIVDKVIQSQWGGINKKRYLIKGRLYRAKKLRQWIPVKRVHADATVYYKNFIDINLNAKIMDESKRLWRYYRNDVSNKRFMKTMALWEISIYLLELASFVVKKIKNIISDPVGFNKRLIHRMIKRLKFF